MCISLGVSLLRIVCSYKYTFSAINFTIIYISFFREELNVLVKRQRILPGINIQVTFEKNLAHMKTSEV